MSKRVYISGPYSGGKWGENVREAVVAGEMVYETGNFPFIPHTHTALWSMMYTHTKREWLHIDLEWVRACDCLIRIEGDSPGGDVEAEYARKVGMPVYDGLDDFLENVDMDSSQ